MMKYKEKSCLERTREVIILEVGICEEDLRTEMKNVKSAI